MRILLIYVEILQVFLFNYIYLSVFVWRCVQVSTDACLEKPKKKEEKSKNQTKTKTSHPRALTLILGTMRTSQLVRLEYQQVGKVVSRKYYTRVAGMIFSSIMAVYGSREPGYCTVLNSSSVT